MILLGFAKISQGDVAQGSENDEEDEQNEAVQPEWQCRALLVQDVRCRNVPRISARLELASSGAPVDAIKIAGLARLRRDADVRRVVRRPSSSQLRVATLRRGRGDASYASYIAVNGDYSHRIASHRTRRHSTFGRASCEITILCVGMYLLYGRSFAKFDDLHVLVSVMNHAQMFHPNEPRRNIRS